MSLWISDCEICKCNVDHDKIRNVCDSLHINLIVGTPQTEEERRVCVCVRERERVILAEFSERLFCGLCKVLSSKLFPKSSVIRNNENNTQQSCTGKYYTNTYWC